MWRDEEEQHASHYVAKHFTEYTKIAGIHGIRFLSRRTAFERLLWGTLIMLCVLVCLAQTIKLISRLYQSPLAITFSTSAGAVYEISFPAVTICPETKADHTRFKYADIHYNYQTKKKTMSPDQEKLYRYFYTLCDTLDPRHTFDNASESFSDDFFETIRSQSIKVGTLIAGCALSNQPYNCSELFTEIFIDEGVCYSFNVLDRTHIFTDKAYLPNGSFESHFKDNHRKMSTTELGKDVLTAFPKRVFTSGGKQALNVFLLQNPKNIDYACKSQPGFKIILHDPMDVPQVRYSSFRTSPNRSFITSISPFIIMTSPRVRKFNPRSRNCFLGAERPLKYFRKYSTSNCMLECLSNYTLLRCECVGYYMPRSKDIPVCGLAKYDCPRDAENELDYLEVQHKHHSKGKQSPEPSFCHCLPSCSNIKYDIEVTSTTNNFKDPSGQLFTSISFFFKKTYFLKLERNEVFTTNDLVAKVGGLFGLFTGTSIVSLVELIYFCTFRLICNKRLYGQWTGTEE